MCSCIYFDVNHCDGCDVTRAPLPPNMVLRFSCLPLKLQQSSVFHVIIQTVASIRVNIGGGGNQQGKRFGFWSPLIRVLGTQAGFCPLPLRWIGQLHLIYIVFSGAWGRESTNITECEPQGIALAFERNAQRPVIETGTLAWLSNGALQHRKVANIFKASFDGPLIIFVVPVSRLSFGLWVLKSTVSYFCIWKLERTPDPSCWRT